MSVNKQLEPLYDEICAKLTDFENRDPKDADKLWLCEFYDLLVKVQSAISSVDYDSAFPSSHIAIQLGLRRL